MTWTRIGQFGSLTLMRLKKYGVMAIARCWPAWDTPARSVGVNGINASNASSEVMRLRNCHRQSFQSASGTRAQMPRPADGNCSSTAEDCKGDGSKFTRLGCWEGGARFTPSGDASTLGIPHCPPGSSVCIAPVSIGHHRRVSSGGDLSGSQPTNLRTQRASAARQRDDEAGEAEEREGRGTRLGADLAAGT